MMVIKKKKKVNWEDVAHFFYSSSIQSQSAKYAAPNTDKKETKYMDTRYYRWNLKTDRFDKSIQSRSTSADINNCKKLVPREMSKAWMKNLRSPIHRKKIFLESILNLTKPFTQ